MNYDHEINYAMTDGEIVNALNDANNCYVKGRPAELAARIEREDIELNGVNLKGTICVEVIADVDLDETVGDTIAHCIVGLPLELVAEDESACVAWYKVVEA